MKKLGVIFGGRSAEHEISILSASSMIDAVDVSRYETVPIGINKNGDWFLIKSDMSGIGTLDDPRLSKLIPRDPAGDVHAEPVHPGDIGKLADFAFPILHGPCGEDGTIQGLFEMLDMPYSGCGVTGSAVSMDKLLTKDIWNNAGLPIGRYQGLIIEDFLADPEREMDRIEDSIPYPVFVKPANMGSSVGVSKAGNRAEMESAARTAFKFDRRVIVEESTQGREIEVGVLGNGAPAASVVGEIIPDHNFYDYESKYVSGLTKLCIPAQIPADAAERVRELALEAYFLLDGAGFSRIDCFYDEKKGNIYLNEMNTIPGFTKFSMFPLLWNESGLAYPDLIERIIELGNERHLAKNNWKPNY